MGKTEILELGLSQFFCPKNEDVQEFIRSKAVEFEQRDLGRTYFIVDEQLTLLEQHIAILGYFTLAMKSIIFSPEISKELKRKSACSIVSTMKIEECLRKEMMPHSCLFSSLMLRFT